MATLAITRMKRRTLTRTLLSLGAIGLSMLLVTEPALAQGAANIQSMAESILDLLTGPLAKTLATIGLVVVGYMYWTGRASMSLLWTFIVGCFLVFSARFLVGLLTG